MWYNKDTIKKGEIKMYKVGDKVKVKDGLKAGCYYDYMPFFNEMKQFSGKVVEISYVSSVHHNRFCIKEDGERYIWTAEMFESIYNPMPKLETGMFVVNRCGDVGIVADNLIVYKDGYDTVFDCRKNDGYIIFVINNGIENCFDDVRANLYKEDGKFEYDSEYLWKYEYKEPKKVTMKEVYEKFGEIVEIAD